jgi:hypothetical protein
VRIVWRLTLLQHMFNFQRLSTGYFCSADVPGWRLERCLQRPNRLLQRQLRVRRMCGGLRCPGTNLLQQRAVLFGGMQAEPLRLFNVCRLGCILQH